MLLICCGIVFVDFSRKVYGIEWSMGIRLKTRTESNFDCIILATANFFFVLAYTDLGFGWISITNDPNFESLFFFSLEISRTIHILFWTV